MRRCRKLISMIVMMAMLATMTPYQAFAVEPSEGTAVQEVQPAAEEEGQDTEETIPEDQKDQDEDQQAPEEDEEAAPAGDPSASEDPSEVAPESDAVESSSTDNSYADAAAGDEDPGNSSEGESALPAQEAAAPEEPGSESPADPVQEEKKAELKEGSVEAQAGGFTVRAEGMLPEGADLVLTKLSDSTVEEVGKGLDKEGQTAVFAYDVTIRDAEGKTWQPEELGVKISISGLDLENKAEVSVAHVLDKEEAVEAAVSSGSVNSEEVSLSSGAAEELKEAVEAAGSGNSVVVTTITEDSGLNVTDSAVSFDVDSFSAFIVFTVDFEYGEYTYSIGGKESVLLSELFAALNIEQAMAEITSVEWEAREEYDPNELISIEKQEEDWKLNSLKAFDTVETLIIKVGDLKEYRIKVTDDEIVKPFIDYELRWNSTVDSGHNYNDDGDLICTPATGSDIYTARLEIYFKFNAAETEELPEGSVSFRVPRYIFENWQGGGNVALNLGDASGAGNWGASLTWQIPQAPNTSPTSSFNYTVDGDYYVMTNWQPIKGDVTLICDIDYRYFGPAVKVDENGVFRNDDVAITMNVDAPEYDFNIEETQKKAIEVHVKTTPTTISKMQDGSSGTNTHKYFSWQNTWGEKPDDADDYFYIYWHLPVTRNPNNTTPFDIRLEELNTKVEVGGTEPIEFTPEDGYIVGITYYQNLYSKHDIGFFVNSDTPSQAGIAGKDLSRRPGIMVPYGGMGTNQANSWTMTDGRAYAQWGVLTRYPKSLFQTAIQNGMTREQFINTGLKITNTAQVFNEQENGATVAGSKASATTYFRLEPVGGAGSSFLKVNDQGTGSGSGFHNIAGGSDILLTGNTVRLGYGGSHTKAFTITTTLAPETQPVYGENGELDVAPYTTVVTDGDMFLTTADTTASQQGSGDCTTWEGHEQLQDGDYKFDQLTLSLVQYKGNYIQIEGENPENPEYLLSTGSALDPDEIEPLKLYVRRAGEEDFSIYGTLKVTGASTFTFTRDPSCSDGVASKTGITRGTGGYGGSVYLTLPANTVDFKLEHTSNAYKGTMYIDLCMTILPSEHVKSILSVSEEKSVNTALTNHAFYQVKDALTGETVREGRIPTHQGNDRYESFMLTSLGRTYNAVKTVFKDTSLFDEVDKAREYYRVVCSVGIATNVAQGNTPPDEILRLFNPDTGFFYDLLPTGCTVDPSTVNFFWCGTHSVMSNSQFKDKSRFTVKVERNWHDTGRDLLIVELLDNSDWPTGQASGNYCITFYMYNSYVNIEDRGTDCINVFGFVNTDEEATKLVPTSSRIGNLGNQQSIMREVMAEQMDANGWDEDYLANNAVYAQNTYVYKTPIIKQTGYSKTVSTEINTNYNRSNKSLIGGEYSYNIRYVEEVGTISGKMVFFDELEQGSFLTDRNTEWQGYFQSIDVDLIRGKPNFTDSSAQCDPVVWYATSAPSDADMTIEGLDSNTSGIWTKTLPDDPKTVKAIAVDCRKDNKGNDYVMSEDSSMSIYIYMVAPYDVELKDKWSVNGTKMISDVGNTTGVMTPGIVHDAYCELQLLVPDLHKSSDPETGTAEEPTLVPVNSTLTYTLALSVGDDEHDVDYTLYNIVITDPIPDGLTVDASKIRYYTDSSATRQTLGSNKKAQVEQDGQNLTFKVRDLAKGATIYLEIPTTVEELKDASGKYISRRDFINTATLESYDDHEVNEETETMYHYAANGKLAISKTVVSPIAADANKEFSFTVKLTGKDVDGEYDAVTTNAQGTETKSTVTFANGTATVTVAGGSTLKIEGLLPGTTYEVTETTAPDFTVDPESAKASGTIEADQTSEASFTNTRKTGNLEISKTVVSPIKAEESKEFTFTVTANDVTLSGDFAAVRKAADGTETEETVTFSASGATVKVAGGETLTIKGLPSAVKYTVTETTDDNFLVDPESASKDVEVAANETVTAAFTNTRKTGNLEISKTIMSPIPAERTQEFTFTVTANDVTLSGDFAAVRKAADGTETDETVTLTASEATVTVAGGETLTIKGLPSAVTYTVTEAADGNFLVDPESASKDVEVAANETVTAAFTNTRKTGNLSVTKEVINKNGTNTAKEFEITVTLEDDTIDGEFGDEGTSMTFVKGVATFTLKDGETKTATGLPSGIGYTVAETADDGFVTTYENVTDETVEVGDDAGGQTDSNPAGETEGISGTIVVDETKSVKVINTYLTEGEYAIEVKKVLEGRLLKEGQFEFELSDSDGEVIQTVKNDLDGNIKFDPIAYTEEDLDKETSGYFKDETLYTYTVKEVIPEGAEDNGDGTFTLDGCTYDAAERTVTLTLKDNGEGTIIVEADKKIEDLTFTNIYEADGEVFIGGVKVLQGQDLNAGQFKFILSDESGKKVLEATNDANGNFEFEVIKYEISDLGGETEKVFSYGVTEVNDGQSNITYDKTAYTIKVTVTDNGDGTLTAKADKSRADIKFTNTYTPPENPPTEKTKHKDSSNTGDSANGALWALILLLAGGALAGTVWFKRRKKS